MAGMTISRRFRTGAAALVVAAVATTATGCFPGMDDYPSRSEVEQAILSAPAFPAKGKPNAESVRIRSVECVRDTGVKQGSRYRCLVSATDGTRFGSEVVVEPGGRWIMTPGWVDAGRLVIQGEAGD